MSLDANGMGFMTGCKVTDMKYTPTSVTFTRLDEALPLPVQKDWLPMLPYTNELKDLNYYGLAVPGVAVSRLSQRPGIRVGSTEATIASEQSAFTLTRSS